MSLVIGSQRNLSHNFGVVLNHALSNRSGHTSCYTIKHINLSQSFCDPNVAVIARIVHRRHRNDCLRGHRRTGLCCAPALSSGDSFPDSQINNLQSKLPSNSVVEGDEEARIAEDALDVFSKFIDEQLLQIIDNPNVETPVRQTVLMTDGTDTRPYRLIWPSPSVIFCASPEPAFIATSIKQIERGLKVPRSSLLQHLSADFVIEDWGDDFVDNLVRKGYRGDVPSAWVIEMPTAELSEVSLQAIFTLASSLLTKGSAFLGVLSCPWMGTSELETRASLGSLCAGHGFTVELLSYEKLASDSHIGVELASPPNMPFAFIARQQRLSDAQVEYGRNQIEMAEEVDEDGFEDAW